MGFVSSSSCNPLNSTKNCPGINLQAGKQNEHINSVKECHKIQPKGQCQTPKKKKLKVILQKAR